MNITINQYLYRPYAIYKIWQKNRLIQNYQGHIPRIYLLNIPSHGNLGDHLISVAEVKFFGDNFPQYPLVKITSSDLFYSIRVALSTVRKQDILCMTGGGYLGSMYDEEERLMRILKLFPNNKVIILPQSVYYEDTLKGAQKRQQALNTYHQHDNLYFIAREQNTYDLLRLELMKGKENHIALTPDIALYLKHESREPREHILWCLRNDGEKNTETDSIVGALTSLFDKEGIVQKSTDTYVNYAIPLKKEQYAVIDKINEFAKARLVVTDRLHGMIFAAITGTPVIAINNSTHKVENVYNLWLTSIPYVRFVKNAETASTAATELLQMSDTEYDSSDIIPKYKPIMDFINA